MANRNRFYGALLLIAALITLTLAACTPADSSGDLPVNDDSGQPAEALIASGEVKSISAKMWNVAGQELIIGGETEIEADIQVGDTVEVHGRSGVDGSTIATQISLDRPAVDAGGNANEDDSVKVNEGDDDAMNGNDDNNNDSMNGNDDDDDAMNGNDDNDNDDDSMNGNDDDDDAMNGNDDNDNDDESMNGNDDDNDDSMNGNDDHDDAVNDNDDNDDDDDAMNGNDDNDNDSDDDDDAANSNDDDDDDDGGGDDDDDNDDDDDDD